MWKYKNELVNKKKYKKKHENKNIINLNLSFVKLNLKYI